MQKLVTAFVLAALVGTAAASPLPDYPMVYARGSAKIDVKPDMCTVDFHITVRDENQTNALNRVKQRSTEVLAILAANGVKKDDIVGYEISKERVRNYENRDRLEFLGYEVSRKIKFTLHDLTKYEGIMSRLLKLSDVVDLDTDFDRTDRKEIESRLLADAVADARAKAELMANGAGQRIVRLRAISQRGFYNISEQFGLGGGSYGGTLYRSCSFSSEEKEEMLFVPSIIIFNNSVSLIYEIEEKK